jgi:hypothetical protein
MRKTRIKPNYRRRVLRLPGLDHCKTTVLNSLGSPASLVGLEFDDSQMRQGHWAVVDLIGKGGHIRTVPIPAWVKSALDQWTRSAGVSEGKIFRAVARLGKVWGSGISQNVSGTWSELLRESWLSAHHPA